MITSADIDQLAKALSAAQGEYPKISKDEEGKIKGRTREGKEYEYSYKYADLAACIEAVKAVNAKHGLAVSQDPEWDGTHDLLSTMVLHESGQWKQSTMRLHLTRDDPQGQGSAITYARRYAFLAALGIAPDEDDDGRAATTRRSTTPPKPVELPEGMVDAGTAKMKLLEAFSGDIGRMREVWGNRTEPISTEDLQAMIGVSDGTEPF